MCPALRQDATRQSEGQLENRPTAGLREADIQIDEGVLGEGMQRNLSARREKVGEKEKKWHNGKTEKQLADESST